MRSLAKNETVTSFSVSCFCNQVTLPPILDVIENNETLLHFGMVLGHANHFSAIATAMKKNSSLLSFESLGFGCDQQINDIRDCIARNRRLVCRAVEFALEPCSAPSASAKYYERFCCSDEFQKMISAIASSPDDAKCLMQRAKYYIQRNVFELTGVVRKVPVSCHPNRKNVVQIDSLNYDCWMKIFSHLKVCDIK